MKPGKLVMSESWLSPIDPELSITNRKSTFLQPDASPASPADTIPVPCSTSSLGPSAPSSAASPSPSPSSPAVPAPPEPSSSPCPMPVGLSVATSSSRAPPPHPSAHTIPVMQIRRIGSALRRHELFARGVDERDGLLEERLVVGRAHAAEEAVGAERVHELGEQRRRLGAVGAHVRELLADRPRHPDVAEQ